MTAQIPRTAMGWAKLLTIVSQSDYPGVPRKTKLSLVMLAICLIGLLSACESVKGVVGTITDGTVGHALQGSTIELFKCADGGCDQMLSSQTTGADGRYSFPDAPAGDYLLAITWSQAPDCPGIEPFQTMGSSGDFAVAYIGYGGIGGYGQQQMLATREFTLTEGGGTKMDLEFTCP